MRWQGWGRGAGFRGGGASPFNISDLIRIAAAVGEKQGGLGD